jgi:hypothetical protein
MDVKRCVWFSGGERHSNFSLLKSNRICHKIEEAVQEVEKEWKEKAEKSSIH